jgi:hypothetical protein
MNNFTYHPVRHQAYLKLILSFFVLIYSGLAMAQETEACNKLECMDESHINKNFVKYYNILNRTLIDARGCKDDIKLDKILEFTSRIRKSTGSRERMAKFLEAEFIRDPVCILSALQRVSQDAKHATALYLAKPSKLNKGKIKSMLEKYEKQFPQEIKLIAIRKEILNIEAK